MLVDRYTKAVLTVIAGCLLWICAMGAGQAVGAQTAAVQKIPNAHVQPVVIVGTGTLDQEGIVTINFIEHDRKRHTDPTLPVTLPYTTASPLPARLSYSPDTPLPVEVTAVKKVGDWEPIRAHVEDAPARPKPGGGGERR